MEKKYKILRFVATIYKIFAWLFLIVGILGLPGGIIYFIILGSQQGNVQGFVLMGLAYGVGSLLAGLVSFILFMAVGQFIYVFLDIEHNTRKAYLLLETKSAIVEKEF